MFSASEQLWHNTAILCLYDMPYKVGRAPLLKVDSVLMLCVFITSASLVSFVAFTLSLFFRHIFFFRYFGKAVVLRDRRISWAFNYIFKRKNHYHLRGVQKYLYILSSFTFFFWGGGGGGWLSLLFIKATLS